MFVDRTNTIYEPLLTSILGSSDANEAVHISIVQAGDEDPITLSSFHPRFTYPIFGDEERIFGYQGLKINLRFAAHDGFPNAEISWDKKFKPVAGTQATDIGEVLSEWMPAGKLVTIGSAHDVEGC